MKNKNLLPLLEQKWYLMWIFLPILVYGLCMISSRGLIYFFPVFLISAQYISLRTNPSSEHPAWWWSWFLGSIFCYGVTYRVLGSAFSNVTSTTDISYVKDVAHYILSFYISQMPAEILMPLIFQQWRIGWWAFGNGIAVVAWMGIFLVLYYSTPFPYSPGNRFSFFWGFVGPSFIANCITGYFLHLGTQD